MYAMAPRETKRAEKEFRRFLANGEDENTEFKRCSKGARDDTFETLCSFANGGGGDIFLGVEDGGTVCGIAKDTAPEIAGGIVRTASNPALFKPPIPLEPEIFTAGGKTLVRIRVPSGGATPHSYKGVGYKRVGDADIAVRM